MSAVESKGEHWPATSDKRCLVISEVSDITFKEDGETERILPAGITERFARGADGTLAPLTAGSTQWLRRVTTAE